MSVVGVFPTAIPGSSPRSPRANLPLAASVFPSATRCIFKILLDAAAEIAPMALAYGFGHVGDGNLHMMILPITDEAVEPWLEVRDAMTAEIDQLVFELDGTLSAEHGVGLLLRDRNEPQKPAIEWEMMRTVKRALDPQNLFNPGKLIPPVG